MVLKEKRFISQTHPRMIAGDAAEKQMAFYLKRSFGNAKNIYVINDLRIEHEYEVAQMDHLIVSQWGLFIVESKSVTESVHINEHEEWAREYKGKKTGMPSPVLQGHAQGRILKELLIENKHALLGNILGIQKGFGYCPVGIYVAISDSGLIKRDKVLPEVMKADAVAPAIETFLRKQSALRIKEFFSLSMEVKDWSMQKEEARRVADFLLTRHTPRGLNSVVLTQIEKPNACHPKSSVMAEGELCPQCGKQKLVRKSMSRSNGQSRDFIICADYPKSCRGIFPLTQSEKEIAVNVEPVSSDATTTPAYQVGDACPVCGDGVLVKRRGKSSFLGCSNFPKTRCKFTDYRDTKPQAIKREIA